MRITIVGGGNLGTLLAAQFANKNEVVILTSKPFLFSNELEVYDKKENLVCKGVIEKATDNWENAIVSSDLIWVTVPPQLFKITAEKMLPYVNNKQMIGIIPGAGGAEFAFKPLIDKGVLFFGLARVPTIARLKEYGKSSYMLGPAPELLIGSIPANNAETICRKIQPLFEMRCRPLANYLTVSFTPSNPVLHTSRLYSMFKDYHEGVYYLENELFYERWTVDAADVLLNVSDELQQLCKAIPLDMRDVESMQSRHKIRTPKELADKICSLDRLKGLYSPVIKTKEGFIPDFSSRYFSSDFTYGIKIIIEVARLFRVPTPTMDLIWEWYNRIQPEKAKDSFSLSISKEQLIDFFK